MRKQAPGKTTRIFHNQDWRAVRKTAELEQDLIERIRKREGFQLELNLVEKAQQIHPQPSTRSWYLRIIDKEDGVVTLKADSPAQLFRTLGLLLS